MSNNMTFRGSFIRSIHLSNPDDGDKTVTLQCTADFSAGAVAGTLASAREMQAGRRKRVAEAE